MLPIYPPGSGMLGLKGHLGLRLSKFSPCSEGETKSLKKEERLAQSCPLKAVWNPDLPTPGPLLDLGLHWPIRVRGAPPFPTCYPSLQCENNVLEVKTENNQKILA